MWPSVPVSGRRWPEGGLSVVRFLVGVTGASERELLDHWPPRTALPVASSEDQKFQRLLRSGSCRINALALTVVAPPGGYDRSTPPGRITSIRSEEHTSELP